MAGALDPVSNGTKDLSKLVAAYRIAGLERVKHMYYPNARHEIFNETNRDEVTADLIGYLDGLVG